MTLVIYDVPDDKIRNRLAVACKDYGLQRVQWSAFLGFLNHNRREELQRRLKRTLGRRMGNIQIYPLCDKDLRLRLEIEGLGGYRAPWRGERAGDPYAGDGDDLGDQGAGKGRRAGYLFVGEKAAETEPEKARRHDKRPLNGEPLNGEPLDGEPLDGEPLDDAPPLDENLLDGKLSRTKPEERRRRPRERGEAGNVARAAEAGKAVRATRAGKTGKTGGTGHSIAHPARKAGSAT